MMLVCFGYALRFFNIEIIQPNYNRPVWALTFEIKVVILILCMHEIQIVKMSKTRTMGDVNTYSYLLIFLSKVQHHYIEKLRNVVM